MKASKKQQKRTSSSTVERIHTKEWQLRESSDRCDHQYSLQHYQAPHHQTSHLHESNPLYLNLKRHNTSLSIHKQLKKPI
jgi:hypothetical protein